MRIAYVVASADTRWGGPVAAVKALSRELKALGAEVVVYAPRGTRVGEPMETDPGIITFPVRLMGRLWTGYAPGLAKALWKDIRGFDVVHAHELWHYPSLAAFRVTRAVRKPFVISPHGELGPWHVRQKRLKKSLYMWIAQRRALNGANVVQALTPQEEQDIRRYVPNARVTVIPNGVDLASYRDLPPRSLLEREYPELHGRTTILFLGRLHQSKGVESLARTFVSVASEFPDVALILAGPDERNLKPRLEGLFRRARVADRVVFPGVITGDRKRMVLGAADLFILPSYGEGFSTAVLEALAAGVPVVLTEACRFPEVARHGAGLVVPTGDEGALQSALSSLLRHRAYLSEMGRRGKRLASEYSWPTIARRMLDMYEEVVGFTRQ